MFYQNSFALLHSDVIHDEADDLPAQRWHDFVARYEQPLRLLHRRFVSNLRVLGAFTAAFCQCISFRIIAFTKTFFRDIKHLVFPFISIKNTSAYNPTSPAFNTRAPGRTARFAEAHIGDDAAGNEPIPNLVPIKVMAVAQSLR